MRTPASGFEATATFAFFLGRLGEGPVLEGSDDDSTVVTALITVLPLPLPLTLSLVRLEEVVPEGITFSGSGDDDITLADMIVGLPLGLSLVLRLGLSLVFFEADLALTKAGFSRLGSLCSWKCSCDVFERLLINLPNALPE